MLSVRGVQVEAVAILFFSFLVDAIIGDPDRLWHPIRLIGKSIAFGERWLRHDSFSPPWALFFGAVLVVCVVLTTYACSAFVLQWLILFSWWLGQLGTILLGSLCLARRSLHEHVQLIVQPLQTGNLEQARLMLARIVSRETERLSEGEVVRGTIESIAENSSDGVIAPLFYMAIGGVPLALAYKAVNTLDSMLGYHTEQYEYFGKVAARLDDAANLLPARLTVLALVGAAWVGKQLGRRFDAVAAWRIAWRDGRKHTSPNAGYPESALAGALGVQLGGSNYYFGAILEKPTLGDARHTLTVDQIAQSLFLLDAASLLALLVCTGGVLLW